MIREADNMNQLPGMVFSFQTIIAYHKDNPEQLVYSG